MQEILRKEYINEIDLYKDKHIIKIITGVRRSGKSTILEQYKRFIIQKYQIIVGQIISYDFNDLRLRELNYKELYDQVVGSAKANLINYVFLDEVQDIKRFEECVISLYENKEYKFDIYITGSNSRMFSSHLATLFTGRNVEIKVYPLSFNEYYQYLREEYNINDKYKIFDLFMQYGSLPICLDSINEPQVMKTKISSVIKDSIQKDILHRHSVRNVADFNRIVKYLLMNIGQSLSTTSIANTINSHNKNLISSKTIDRYIEWVSEAIIIYRCYFYSLMGKRILSNAGKVYAVDQGIRNFFTNFSVSNRGSILENIVYVELLRRKFDEIYIGKLWNNKEVDFVVIKGGIKTYFQVCESIASKAIEDREIGNLISIKDYFPKILLVLNGDSRILDNGIQIINLIDWLLLIDNK